MNISHKLKELGKGNKIQIKREEIVTTEVPAQYYPNHEFSKKAPEIHTFNKSMRTSSILAEALHRDYHVEMGDPTFTMLKTNVAPGYYDSKPMASSTELGFFPKSKRIEVGGDIN